MILRALRTSGSSIARLCCSFAVVSLLAHAQSGRVVDWFTHSGNPQRTGWQKNENTITKENVKDFKLLWKLQLDNEQKALYSIFEPLIVGNMITNRGFKELAIVAGSSDNIYAIDADLGKVLWKKHFSYSSSTPPSKNSNWLCPGGLTATPVIPPPLAFTGRAATPEATPPPAPNATAP